MVEKRKHPLVALLFNQLLYAVISFVIVTTMSGSMQLVFGLFFFLLYLSGVYSYAHKAGTDHQKSYSKIPPHIKFPLCYALIAILYLVIPLGIYELYRHWYVYLAVIFWNAPFFFGHIISLEEGVNLVAAGVFSGCILVVTCFGYFAGVKQFYLISLVHKLLYRPVEEDPQETKKEQ